MNEDIFKNQPSPGGFCYSIYSYHNLLENSIVYFHV